MTMGVPVARVCLLKRRCSSVEGEDDRRRRSVGAFRRQPTRIGPHPRGVDFPTPIHMSPIWKHSSTCITMGL